MPRLVRSLLVASHLLDLRLVPPRARCKVDPHPREIMPQQHRLKIGLTNLGVRWVRGINADPAHKLWDGGESDEGPHLLGGARNLPREGVDDPRPHPEAACDWIGAADGIENGCARTLVG